MDLDELIAILKGLRNQMGKEIAVFLEVEEYGEVKIKGVRKCSDGKGITIADC